MEEIWRKKVLGERFKLDIREVAVHPGLRAEHHGASGCGDTDGCPAEVWAHAAAVLLQVGLEACSRLLLPWISAI